jgi:hypothetical protein
MTASEVDRRTEVSVPDHQDTGDGFLLWLLALAGGEQDSVPDPPPASDPDVLRLAQGMAECVSSGCLDPATSPTVFDVAGHAGRHAGDAGLKTWTRRAFRLAMHEASQGERGDGGTEATAATTPARSGWGPWSLHTDEHLAPWLELEHAERTWEVNLGECTTPYQALNELLQVAEKHWADDRTTAGLARALNVVLHARSSLSERRDNPRMAVELIRTRAHKLAAYGVMCGECGVTKIREQFRRDGGCCSRRAADLGNRWPGDG